MSRKAPRTAHLVQLYQAYLVDRDSANFVKQVSKRYLAGTLERLAVNASRMSRRSAVLALGYIANYDSNGVLGRALRDDDRGVRLLAESSIQHVWRRAGSATQRRDLLGVMRLISAHQFSEAIMRATELIEQAPAFAETWNQRAIANYHGGRHVESIRDCHQTLDINPYHFAAAAGMGQCHLRLSNHKLALDSFRHALRLYPDLEGVRANVDYLERSLRRKNK